MRIKLLILSCILFLAVIAYYSYSLNRGDKRVIEARLYLDSALYYKNKNEFDKALFCFDTLIKFNIDSFKIESWVGSAQVKIKQGLFNEAAPLFRKAMEYKDFPTSAWLAKINYGLASVYIERANYDSAMFYAKESLKTDSSLTNQSYVYQRMGIINNRQGNYPEAIKYQTYALKAATAADKKESIASILNSMGGIYAKMDEDEKALTYFDSCQVLCNAPEQERLRITAFFNAALIRIKMKNYERAENDLKEVLSISETTGFTHLTGDVYENLGRIHYEKKQLQKALEWFELAKTNFEARQSSDDISRIGSHLANVYTDLHEYDKAEKLIHAYKDWSLSVKNSHELMIATNQLFRLDSMRGDFKHGAMHLLKAGELADSIFNIEKREMIEEVTQKYTAEQNQKVIALQQVQLQEEKNNNLIIIIIALLSTGTLLLLYFLYRQRQKALLLRVMEESQRKRVSAILETQERVQQSIARDLHDGLVQILGAVKLSMESILPGLKDELNQKVQHSSTMIDEACQEVRSMSHQLLPHTLNKEGLPGALHELGERSLRKKIPQFEFKISGTVQKLDPTMEIHLYRIAQELVNNILRHSAATSVFMYVTFLNKSLVLWVEDNGQGFNNKNSLGVGLLNIMTRLEMIGGQINIETSPGNGTSVSISVPYA